MKNNYNVSKRQKITNNIEINPAIEIAKNSITVLELHIDDVRSEEATLIFNTLKINKSITYLNLSSMSPSSLVTKAVVDLLRVNKTITSLKLPIMTYQDSHKVAEALRTNSLDIFKTLAAEYNVPFLHSSSLESDAHCPGIVDPLHSIPHIQFNWYSGYNHDRTERYHQFYKALKAIDCFVKDGSEDSLKTSYKGLEIHGRAMLAYISSLNILEKILYLIAPYAKIELIDDQISDLHKHCSKITNKELFNQYINPIIKQHTQEVMKKAVLSSDCFIENEELCDIIGEYAAYDYIT